MILSDTRSPAVWPTPDHKHNWTDTTRQPCICCQSKLFKDIFREYVSTFFKRYVSRNHMFVMFIAPGKKSAGSGDIHKVMKKMEQEYSTTLSFSKNILLYQTS